MSSDSPTIGIDLGTTNSAIAHAEAGNLDVLPNANGKRQTPSVVAFTDGGATVGQKAVNQAAKYPDRTVFSVKRFMGTDEEIMLGKEGRKSAFWPEELSALILKKLKHDAEEVLDKPIENAVITVPAYFNDRQRQATKHAGEIAGVEVERILNEPTAACFAYGLRTGDENAVLVYDLGGGTFDVSLIEIQAGVFEVIATNGDTQLGGDDWDAAIVRWLVKQIERDHGATVDDCPPTRARLFAAAKRAKHDLSSRQQARITLPFLEIGNDTYDVEQTLTRDTFQEITHECTDATIDICEELFAGVGYGPQAIDEVLLVGGATRMPHIQNRVSEYFGREPSKRVNPDEAVALGAAAQAAVINQQALPAPDPPKAELSPTHEGTSTPTTRDADEIVLLDVTPQSVGVEAVRDRQTLETQYEVLVPRNTPIPVQEAERYTTVQDNQDLVDIAVYQGEGTLEENELLDEFRIGPIPPRPAGEPTIEITFRIDQNGIFQVSAEDVDHDIRAEIEIESIFGFTQDQLHMMRKNLPTVR